MLTRRLTQAGLDHPVDCPCGAVLCRCGGTDRTCVGPAPIGEPGRQAAGGPEVQAVRGGVAGQLQVTVLVVEA
jgi:hypothetical protein